MGSSFPSCIRVLLIVIICGVVKCGVNNIAFFWNGISQWICHLFDFVTVFICLSICQHVFPGNVGLNDTNTSHLSKRSNRKLVCILSFSQLVVSICSAGLHTGGYYYFAVHKICILDPIVFCILLFVIPRIERCHFSSETWVVKDYKNSKSLILIMVSSFFCWADTVMDLDALNILQMIGLVTFQSIYFHIFNELVSSSSIDNNFVKPLCTVAGITAVAFAPVVFMQEYISVRTSPFEFDIVFQMVIPLRVATGVATMIGRHWLLAKLDTEEFVIVSLGLNYLVSLGVVTIAWTTEVMTYPSIFARLITGLVLSHFCWKKWFEADSFNGAKFETLVE